MKIPYHKKLFLGWGLLFMSFLFLSVYYEMSLLVIIPFALVSISFVISYPQCLFYLLIFFLPLSFEYKFSDTLGTDLPDEFLMIVVTGVFLLLLAGKPALIKKEFFEHPLFILLLLHVCWIAIAVLYSQNIFLSLKFLAAKTWFIASFVLFPFLIFKSRKAFISFSLCLVIPMLFVVLQSFLRHINFGFSFEKINNTLSPYFRNHVNYGAMLVCMLPIVAGWVYLSANRLIKLLAICILFIFIGGLFLSFSRGAWLAILVALITVWMIRKKIIHWFFLAGAITITISFIWMANGNRYLDYRPDFRKTIFHKDFKEHMAATYRGRDLSTAERFYRWTAAKNMITTKPLFGVGPNNFYDSYKPYATGAYKTWVSDNREHSTVHNYFLLLLTEQGIPGLVLFCSLIFSMFWYAQKVYHGTEDNFYKTISLTLAAILSMIITVNFLSDLIETDKVGSLFFLCLGLLIVITIEKKSLTTCPYIESIS